MWTLLLACAASTPEPAPATPATPAPAAPASGEPAPTSAAPGPGDPTVPTLLGDVKGVAFVGDWTSPSCGGRAYARNIHFDAENSYAGIDLVSPCPTGTTCVWSGMIAYAGIWVQEGDRLKLREIGGPTGPGSPHPTEFTATVEGSLVENGCAYSRGLTVPAGYEEDRVRPKIPTK